MARCAAALALAAVLLLGPVALGGCTGLVFHPTREHVLTPDRVGLAYRDVWFEAEDGVRLHGWFLPAQGEAGEAPAGSVLFLHGNAENVSTHLASVYWLPAAGFNVLLLDYRGYGLSGGEPSLPGLHRDVAAALDALLAQEEVDPERVAVLGQSLGGALAVTALAAEPRLRERIRALVVEGAFTGYRDLAREKLAGFWLTWPLQAPLSYAIDGRYQPAEAIGRLGPEVPVLLIHGQADEVVPPHHARELFAAAREPKALWLVPGAGHIAALAVPETRRRLADYLRRALERPVSATDRRASAA